ncbi:MAG: argininosuccinate lyase [Gammaproteobacteria bacterium]|nr:argininosuccinate lyase [Gammaproteobacteria bacterium]
MNHPSKDAGAKLLQGRILEDTDQFVEAFTASVSFDQRLYRHDIRGSIAHCRMLAHVGVLSSAEAEQIQEGLRQIEGEIDAGEFQWRTGLEDVHMNIEHRLIALIGETGKKLHTARSRNDQVATDLRLYLRDEIDALLVLENALASALLDLAERYSEAVMPGYTHLQAAQPISFGHHLLAWFEMLLRDRDRLLDCRRRVNQMPLGAAALAGTTFPIDRAFTARELGFEGVAGNSLDAVSDRDFAIEFTAAAALTMMHLSRWCEELVLWTSQPFAFVSLPDRFCTGSSIMPQKKNPDVPELVRGKAGRVFGDLAALLTLMKGQPLAYNKDNQEDKEPLFDAVDTLRNCLTAMLGLLPHIEADTGAMARAARQGFATATDFADYLVRRGAPFRDAHEAVGKAVAYAVQQGIELDEIPLAQLKMLAGERVEADVFDVLTVEGSLAARNHFGGTAPAATAQAIKAGRERIAAASP